MGIVFSNIGTVNYFW